MAYKKLTKQEIEDMCKPVRPEYQEIYYVYQAFVDGELKYIGKGKGKRIDHCLSGASSCVELNRDFHLGKNIEVVKYKEKLQESEADYIEMSLINEYKDKGIYNKRFTTDLSSKPNLERMKDVKVIAALDDEKAIKVFCTLAPEITKHAFEELNSFVSKCGLSIYLAEVKGSKPMLIIDKPKHSDYEIRHLGCPNWPNCNTEGCGRDYDHD